MKSLLLALQFLTLAPVRVENVSKKEIAKSAVFFPMVGVLLGLALSMVNDWLSALAFPRLSVDIILVVLLVILTGGIHLDGLSDTFDAILSRKTKDEMLVIMRDSHAGVMGILAIVAALLLKVAFLYAIIDSHKLPALILMCVFGRYAMVFMMRTFVYARPDGKAKIFFDGMNQSLFMVSTLVVLCIAVAIGNLRGLGALAIVIGFAYLFGKHVSNKVGGITGDTLGATNEMVEVASLASVALLGRLFA